MLYTALRRAAPANTRRVIDVYARELPEYRALTANPAGHAQLLDFGVFLRRRGAELAAGDQPFTAGDLATLAAAGEERGRAGVSRAVARHAVTLSITASIREIGEAAGPADLEDTLHLLAWLGREGEIGRQEFALGVLRGEKARQPVIGRARRFAELALAGDPSAPRYAEELGLRLADRHQVVVVRCAAPGHEDVLETVWRRHRAPATWHRPGELAALLPAGQDALALVRTVADGTGQPCAVGAATGPLAMLADVFTMARRVSRVAPARPVPDQVHTVADLFLEIGVAESPEIDEWLRDIARRLAEGPDLVPTLAAFYRNDLDRPRTANTLNIHPRTLDYRLRRTRELTGFDPRDTTGIRIFTTAITRAHG
jgi:hypothetical protein